jgi:hypothetical protein
VLPKVVDGMIEMGILQSHDDVAFAKARCIDFAYVIFDHAYFPSLEVVKPFLNDARIVAAGRYGDWNYSSMEDALLFGRDAAKKARGFLA